MRSFFPKEHGAYGQVSFPLVAAFAVAGVSSAGLLVAVATIAGFLAHEPALIVLGARGRRARRDLSSSATIWLGCWAAVGAAAGLGALLVLDPSVRPWVAVPLVPAILLAVDAVRGKEKSWHGETAAALAFSGVAVPVAMAAGTTAATAIAVAVPFAFLFVSSTLAVRVVILRVRGGGNPAAASATRRAALLLAIAGGAALAILSFLDLVPVSSLAASGPGLLTAAVIALRPPAPTHLRSVGWTLVGVTVLTTAIVIGITPLTMNR